VLAYGGLRSEPEVIFSDWLAAIARLIVAVLQSLLEQLSFLSWVCALSKRVFQSS